MIARLRLEAQLLMMALQFMSRLPVPQDLPWSDDLSIRATKYYPLVGAIIGGIGAATLWLAALIFPPTVAVLVSLAATVLATGALHEDGLADAADGLGGGATADRALEIMKDSRIGSYGAVALALTLALKVAVLVSLPTALAGCALVVGHVMGRLGAVHIIATTPYARSTGSRFSAPGVTPDGHRIALATGIAALALFALYAGVMPMLCAAIGAIAFGQAFRWLFVRKLDGYTGDCLGGTIQLTELGFLLGALAWL